MSIHLNQSPRSITESSQNESNSVGHTHAIDKASVKQAGIVKLVDSLESKSKTEALTANQGRELAKRLSLLAQSNGSEEINHRLESALSYLATRYTAAYATYETAKANLCKHPENSLIYVVNDPTKENNGLWTIVGGRLVKAPWDALSSAGYVEKSSAYKTYDPPSIEPGATVTTTIILSGATVGSIVQAAFSQYHIDIEISAAVSATNIVTVKFKNTGEVAVDLANGTLTVKMI